ncbi:hypothetical protein [Avibacterium paragallinarum]
MAYRLFNVSQHYAEKSIAKIDRTFSRSSGVSTPTAGISLTVLI